MKDSNLSAIVLIMLALALMLALSERSTLAQFLHRLWR